MKDHEMMKNRALPLILVLILLAAAVMSAAGEDETEPELVLPVIPVDQHLYYMCGDVFEMAFPDVISTGSMFTNAGYVQAEAAKDESLLQVRVQLRNMTEGMFHGISIDSFKLTGYVRDRSLTYTPELILNTDYFGSGNYFAWDQLPPLRVADILLVFRVNPILINWELSFVPKYTGEQTYEFGRIVYEPEDREPDPCYGLFQFPVLRNLETGALTVYERE